ncbi:DUF6624 domain-containing protein [Chitinophaga polysaccharea]|uniref:DUF6624 domain-containing protein n=1 Tax=Chitinophaga polysaccharea TaxID=1293035 RepID=UPI001158E8D4|nr:DUF6624 domain-containing protein [Chitinophaga polysaccharea]
MKLLPLIICTWISSLCLGQTPEGYYLLKKADSLLSQKEYQQASAVYTTIINSQLWKISEIDYYNLCKASALSGNKDSAFSILEILATKLKYYDLKQLSQDDSFSKMHKDSRWKRILNLVSENKLSAQRKKNLKLEKMLVKVFDDDQKARENYSNISNSKGFNSPEADSVGMLLDKVDSINLTIVEGVLDNYGWLGKEVVSEKGTNALWLIIDHAEPAIQKKYIGIMKKAIGEGTLEGKYLALVEDRIALDSGKQQIYGTQYTLNEKSNVNELLPVIDIEHIDIRRAKVGLTPLREYLKENQITIYPKSYR